MRRTGASTRGPVSPTRRMTTMQGSPLGSKAAAAWAVAPAARSSAHTGVTWDKDRSKWKARIRIGGKVKALGYYEDEEVAAAAIEEAKRDASNA